MKQDKVSANSSFERTELKAATIIIYQLSLLKPELNKF